MTWSALKLVLFVQLLVGAALALPAPPSWSVGGGSAKGKGGEAPSRAVFVDTEEAYLREIRRHSNLQERVEMHIHVPSDAVLVDVPRPVGSGDATPEQIHLSATGKESEMVVSWITPKKADTIVMYGKSGSVLTMNATGTTTDYRYVLYESGTIHFATMTHLLPGQAYDYKVGDGSEWSDTFTFSALPPVGKETPIIFSVVGDLGQTDYSKQTIEHMTANKGAAMILHNGDLSYADSDQPRWDNWGRLIQPLATTMPWQTCAGNHEIEEESSTGAVLKSWKFVAYNHRFLMPSKQSGGSENLWYSFDVASAHIIALNSYSDFSKGSDQYNWLHKDLAAVDRDNTPWLFVMLHSPWYNSNHAHHNEVEEVEMRKTFEQLFFDQGVDLVMAGHVHAYERMHNVFANATNPAGPIYINIGDGGNREGLAADYYEQPDWSAFREAAYGHGRLEIFNSTHTHWTWHRDLDHEDVVSDEVWMVRS